MSEQAGSPLVSVITPVYNGERYLAECIESVCTQTYDNFEYIIVNNCSTDRTEEIIKNYVKEDSRIQLHTNSQFLSLLLNWNHALQQISATSKYVKVVHADDLLFSTCLEDMVETAEANPSVGIVGAYRIDGTHVNLDAITYPTCLLPGREICRQRLFGKPDMFGSPSSLMYRANLVRSREKFYNEDNLHADSEVCFELLQDTDFGFAHKVLTYTRRHNEAITSKARSINTQKISQFLHLVKYGPIYLNREEYRRQFKKTHATYYRFLAQYLLIAFLKRESWSRCKELLNYHVKTMDKLGYPISYFRIMISMLVVAYNKALSSIKI